ncbi:hypothetical protein [Frigidibacter sp.]|uniref:hypothetical protein n=1 Tax=Frigidibacter sp. TaxID=2586418 RepID=UPI0027366B08|nr:hypothetical protein [Frigidibacter sp.]MDP3339384.1 hypothetical protein [Frigidibacter sp.]
MKTPRKTSPQTDADAKTEAPTPDPVAPQDPLILGPEMGTPTEPEGDAPDLRNDPLTEPMETPEPEAEAPDLRSDPLPGPFEPVPEPQPDFVLPPPVLDTVDPEPKPVAEPISTKSDPEAAPESRRRGGFFPALLGGVIAAGLGAGAALYLLPEGWQPAGPSAEEIARDEATQTQLAALTAEIEALKSAPAPEPDTSLVETTEALSRDLAAANDAQAEALTRLQDIETRLESLESGTGFGGSTGGVEPGTVDAVRAEMEAMRQLIEEQRGAQQEVAAAAASAEERLAAAEAEAARLASEAEAAATAAQSRAALSHLRAALESGAPLAPVIENLSAAGLTVPEALTTLPDGVPTLGSLQDSFPEAARAALAASLPVTAGTGTWDRVGAFLQAQTGARSLGPREGTDPDAVLSRAEAALTAGDLPGTLAELEGLPAEGRAETAAWEAQAASRIAATGAADALAADIQ